MSEILKLKKSNCRNCHKCIRSCTVKSIRFSAEQANIIEEDCILCGRCFVVCPQQAKQISSDREKVNVMLYTDKVYASIAPSFAAAFPGIGIDEMERALKELGFAGVEETALGATVVKREYERILEEEKPDVLISSCCSSINLFIAKYHPNALEYLAEVKTPLQAHCTMIKNKDPEAKTVFIGPCISKKEEAEHSEEIDAVLTFEELKEWFAEKKIYLRKKPDETKPGLTRLFPVTGGVIETMHKNDEYTYMSIDGLKNCEEVLREIEQGNLKNCFIEMNSCAGGCVNGPVLAVEKRTPIKNYKAVCDFAGKEDFDVVQPPKEDCQRRFLAFDQKKKPTEDKIQEVLLQMGKKSPKDCLNCGSCGYESCRDKAIAVIEGKAEVSMCLPYMMEKTQSFSNMVVEQFPNGIITFNDDLEIQDINHQACKILNIYNPDILKGENINRIMDPSVIDKFKTGRQSYSERKYLPEYECYVERTINYAKDFHFYICTIKDVTEEMEQKSKKMQSRNEAVKIADEVAKKQLEIVQEIASLLGETAADTMSALEHLKETIADD